MKNEYNDTNRQFHHQFPNPFQHQTNTTTSDQEDNTSSAATAKQLTSGDGATIEVVRRSRGRPPGSKNKPKPPIIITQTSSSSQQSMSPYILQLPAGADIVASLARFSSRHSVGLVVLSASGTISNVTLRHPSSSPASLSTVTFHGIFEVLSISATFLPNSRPIAPNGFTISLAGPKGQIVGGIVAGDLVAAGNVYIIAASFNNPTYQRLPVEEDDVEAAPSGGEVIMYSSSSQMGATDVIWDPTARQPPPPPSY